MSYPTFHYTVDKDHNEQYDDELTPRELFAKKFSQYLRQSDNYFMDEFVGDRVFNLEMALRLSLSHTTTTAKSAMSVYTSNRTMSEAMEQLGLTQEGDMLSSDLEVACSVAHRYQDTGFVSMAVQVVIEHALASTSYNDSWFEEMGKKIGKKEKNAHQRTGGVFKIDYSKEPVGQLMGYCDILQMPHPEPAYCQSGTQWRCTISFKGTDYNAVSNTKKDSFKSCAQQILNTLVQ